MQRTHHSRAYGCGLRQRKRPMGAVASIRRPRCARAHRGLLGPFLVTALIVYLQLQFVGVQVGRGDRILNVVVYVVKGAIVREASIKDVPLAQDGPASATTNALPLLSSVTKTEGPVPKGTSSGPIHVIPPAQRAFSSGELTFTTFWVKTDGNSTRTTVWTLEVVSSSTSRGGRAVTPGVVFLGGRTVKVVVTVVNGGASRLAVIRLVPAAQDGPPHTTADAPPSLSRNTSNDS